MPRLLEPNLPDLICIDLLAINSSVTHWFIELNLFGVGEKQRITLSKVSGVCDSYLAQDCSRVRNLVFAQIVVNYEMANDSLVNGEIRETIKTLFKSPTSESDYRVRAKVVILAFICAKEADGKVVKDASVAGYMDFSCVANSVRSIMDMDCEEMGGNSKRDCVDDVLIKKDDSTELLGHSFDEH